MLAVVFFLVMLVVWVAMVGRLGPADAVYGLAVIASAWGVFRRVTDLPLRVRHRRLIGLLGCMVRFFALYVMPEMLRSTLRVFVKVFSPQLGLRPAITAVALPGTSQTAMLLLAYGISLTPGQQVVAVDEARRTLYVHTMDAPDPDEVRRRILALYERFLKEETA